jgi:hypothetical protein
LRYFTLAGINGINFFPSLSVQSQKRPFARLCGKLFHPTKTAEVLALTSAATRFPKTERGI